MLRCCRGSPVNPSAAAGRADGSGDSSVTPSLREWKGEKEERRRAESRTESRLLPVPAGLAAGLAAPPTLPRCDDESRVLARDCEAPSGVESSKPERRKWRATGDECHFCL